MNISFILKNYISFYTLSDFLWIFDRKNKWYKLNDYVYGCVI